MPLNKKPVVVIWNSAAGWTNDSEQERCVEQTLAYSGSALQVERVGKGQDITGKSQGLVRGGCPVVVAAGGDGTINAVARALVHTDTALGIIPAGTLNHLARDLSIPLTVEGAAENLVNGSEIVIDVGSVNGRIFLNNSVLGLYPFYRAARDAYERRGLGANRWTRFLAVVRGMIRVFWHLPKLHLTLTLDDGRSVRARTAFVLVANNEHEVEQWNIGHRQRLDEGSLWIYVLRSSTRWGLAKTFLRFLFKRVSRHQIFDIFKARSVRVETRSRHLRAGVDGEIVRFETPLEYCSLPGALRVIAPLPAERNGD